MRTRSCVALLCLLAATTASALNNRSAVSVAGLDTNPCTVTLPCRSFGVAIGVTAAGGEVVALDSAGYGPFSIGGSFTISGAPGVHAAITVNSGHGITHDASTMPPATTNDRVVLRNLVLIGAGGDYGIYHKLGADLIVQDCLIRGFTAGGIYSDDFDGRLVVDRCVILDNGSYGIFADGGLLLSDIHVRQCIVQGNSTGVYVGYNIYAVVTDSTVTDSSFCGVYGYNVNGNVSQPTRVLVESTTIGHNATGVYAAATNAGSSVIIDLSQNVIAYNGAGAASGTSLGGTAAVNSFANNRFVGNGADGGPFPPVAFK